MVRSRRTLHRHVGAVPGATGSSVGSMTTADPLLKALVADTVAVEESIPLDLYLPSGRVYGHTTSHEDFCRWATNQVNRESGYAGTIPPSPDPEYVHLIVQPLTMPDDPQTSDVVRIRLADVIAWTVG